MDTDNNRLSQITTRWTQFIDAHASETGRIDARGELLLAYVSAVDRYIRSMIKNDDDAADLCQEFAIRFLRGDFRRADRSKGQFRKYLKTSLIHLVKDYYRKRGTSPGPIEFDVPIDEVDASFDEETLEKCETLLEQAWQKLQQENSNYYAVLKFRRDNPDMTSRELADRLTEEMGRTITAANVRKTQERAQRRLNEIIREIPSESN